MSSIRQRTVVDGDQVHNVWEQPDRAAILDANRRILNDRSARRMEWAQPHLRIPEIDLELLKKANPDLASPDGQIRRAAWVRFYNSPESAPYRVRVKSGGATNRSFLGGKQ